MQILANSARVDIQDVRSNNGKIIDFVYMNQMLVWQRMLTINLAQQNKTFNLRGYINSNNPTNTKQITVVNDKNQPSMESGNLAGLDVVFINTIHGKIDGTSPGHVALHITSKMKLLNNGFIRGAGGNGKAGSWGKAGANIEGTKSNNYSSSGTTSAPHGTYRVAYTIKSGGGGGAGKGSVGSGYDDFNWRIGGGWEGNSLSGTFNTTGKVSYSVGAGGKKPVYSSGCSPTNGNTGGSTSFGSRSVSGGKGGTWTWRSNNTPGYSSSGHNYQSGFNNRYYYGQGNGGDGQSAGGAGSISVKWYYKIIGGKAGTPGEGGTGESYTTNRTNGTSGGRGGASSPAGGNSGTNGTAGGRGGSWGERGGNNGNSAGYAIIGKDFLSSDSDIGKTSGSIK